MDRTRLPVLARCVLLVALGAHVSACSNTAPAPAHEVARAASPELRRAALGAIDRLHLSRGVWLASQPAPADFAALAGLGVRTVIDLRAAAEHGDFDERAAVEAAGMAYVNVPFHGASELTDLVFDRVRSELAGAEGDVLLHCNSGNRVGAVWLPFRVLDQGVELETALAEARAVGLSSGELEALARRYVAGPH